MRLRRLALAGNVFAFIASGYIQVAAQDRASQSSPNLAAWKPVADAVGKAGVVQPDGAYTIGFPRPDLKVSVMGLQVKPILALASSVTFSAPGADAMMMGDLVLTEEEVTPVLTRFVANGLSVTALHNHLIGETPRLLYLHVSGHGDAVQLGRGVREALALNRTAGSSTGAAAQPTVDFDVPAIEQILGRKGRIAGGGFQIAVPRPEVVTEHGIRLTPSMGLNTIINFQSLGGGKAAMTGDIVLLPGEVDPVIQALRANAIEITALHSHMLDESPRLLFLHFWATDDVLRLATGMRAALDKTSSAK